MRISCLVLLILCAVQAGCGTEARTPPPAISGELQVELETWLAEHGQPPDDYILALFDDHDVVLLGEYHRIRHDAEFVQALLPQLAGAGVTVFATEFARRTDQPLIDSLLAAPDWDEPLAREIQFRMFMPWGYREYIDIFRAAWEVVQRGGDLRVIGVNNTLDYSRIESEEDWNDDAVWERVTGGQTEADWARAVLDAVDAGQKVLVYCGYHHAFTGFRQPRVAEGRFREFGRLRMGNVLRATLGERAVAVFLHAPWPGEDGYGAPTVHPAGGRLDAFMLARDCGPFAVGFDLRDSPLAGLEIEDAVYRHGYERLTIETFCDGWIYTRPLSEYHPVTYIENWIHEGNVDAAHAAAMNPRWRDDSIAQLNAGCRSYLEDFVRYFGHLR
jgi:hypothetical protein